MSQDSTIQEKLPLQTLVSEDSFQKTLMNLVNHYSTRYISRESNGVIDSSDLFNEAILGAATAYRTYDPNRGVLFKTYAYPYMKHLIESHCKRYCHSLTISEKASRDNLCDMTDVGLIYIDQLIDNEQYSENDFDIPVGSGVEYSDDVNEYFFMGFSNFEKQIARDHMINNYSLAELAIKYSISKSRAGSIIKGLIERMKDRARRYVDEND